MATTNESLPAPGVPATSAADGVIGQFAALLRGLRGSQRRRRIGLLAAGLVLVICANVVGQILLIRWQGAFYDAIEQKLLREFGIQLLVFAAIASALLVFVVAQTWLQEMMKVRLREWLTYDLLDQWMVPKRAYLLSFAGQIGVNPDQRIHQDTQRLTELTTILGVGLLQASLLLISFIGMLWLLSAQVVFEYAGRSFVIPGYMVWCAPDRFEAAAVTARTRRSGPGPSGAPARPDRALGPGAASRRAAAPGVCSSSAARATLGSS